MAYQDAHLTLSDSQALTATTDSTDYFDVGGDFDLGRGEPLAVVFNVEVAADFTTGDETYNFIVETDDNTSFSSATTLGSSGAVNGDTLPVGTQVVIPIGISNERYIQASYTLAGTSPSVVVTAQIKAMHEIDTASGVSNPSGFTIT